VQETVMPAHRCARRRNNLPILWKELQSSRKRAFAAGHLDEAKPGWLREVALQLLLQLLLQWLLQLQLPFAVAVAVAFQIPVDRAVPLGPGADKVRRLSERSAA
jgi:hypothetical protein